MKKDICVLIMAGGIGTRFWPKSTENMPKQFINLIDEKTMIQLTVERVRKMIPIEKIFISTVERYVNIVRGQIPDLPEGNIIIEPIGRNTAPCILLSALYIKQIYEDCNVVVLPSDHLVKNVEKFLDTLKKANEFVNDNEKSIVTIGITPNRPEIGYGYIKYNKEKKGEIVKVEKFVEKPNFEMAEKYLESKEYLWNAGMFIFNINCMLNELEINYNSTFKLLKALPSIYDKDYMKVLKNVYPNSESISIDYAVMEKAKNIYVIPVDFGWDDIGTWHALERYMKKDEKNNIAKGRIEFENSNNCIAYGENKRVVFIDVDDIFYAEGEDTIIISKKQSIDKIKSFRK